MGGVNATLIALLRTRSTEEESVILVAHFVTGFASPTKSHAICPSKCKYLFPASPANTNKGV